MIKTMDEEMEKTIQLKEEYLKEKEYHLLEKKNKSKGGRNGWAEAFAKYAEEGEDELLLPDFLDNEAEREL